MRFYQEIGLKKEAREWLNKNARTVPCTVCPKCKEIISKKMDVIKMDHEDLFYGDGPYLRTIRLQNGETVKEVLQTSPWSSGPMAFFCLELKGKKMFKWKKEEIIEEC